jgi:hypothetical protein
VYIKQNAHTADRKFLIEDNAVVQQIREFEIIEKEISK